VANAALTGQAQAAVEERVAQAHLQRLQLVGSKAVDVEVDFQILVNLRSKCSKLRRNNLAQAVLHRVALPGQRNAVKGILLRQRAEYQQAKYLAIQLLLVVAQQRDK
nr:hypothetical protein [Tanacetum cinerariifolium]